MRISLSIFARKPNALRIPIRGYESYCKAIQFQAVKLRIPIRGYESDATRHLLRGWAGYESL